MKPKFLKFWLSLIIPRNAPHKPTRNPKHSQQGDHRGDNKPPNGGMTEFGYQLFGDKGLRSKW